MRQQDDAHEERSDASTARANRGLPGKRTLSSAIQRRERSPIAARAATSAPPAAATAQLTDDPFGLHNEAVPAVAHAEAPVQLRRGTVAGTDAGTDAGTAGASAASALPDAVRTQMEASFSADFSNVRVREDASATALGADAYTQGSEITFAPGRLQFASQEGKELLGHELSHVVQQREGRVSTPQARGGTAINADASLEREADEHGARAARGEPIGLPATARSGAPSSDTVQLKRGKANRALTVRIGEDEVLLPRGTQIDTIDDTSLTILSGQHQGKKATFDDLGAVEFEKELRVGSHEVYKGCSTGFVGRPRATALDDNVLTVEVTLQTRNMYDRATWTSRVVTSTRADTLQPATFVGPRDDDDGHVQNPAWQRGGQPLPDVGEGSPHGYQFRPDFGGYGGAPHPSALRTITFQYDIDCLKRAAATRLGMGRHQDVSLKDIQRADVWIALGINCRYDEAGRTPSYKSRDADPLAATCGEHMYGVTAMSTPWQNGIVDMSAVLAPQQDDRMQPDEFMEQPLPQNPPNNLELPFPQDYLQTNPDLAPLVPARFLDLDEHDTPTLGMDRSSKEIQLKLQTRIESEATLKVGSKDALDRTVLQLLLMGDSINEIMTKDPLLGSFTWSLTPTETLVFTDEYMDDDKCRALRSGIGIRKRRSSTASKLNVKTGKGYQVHEPSHEPKPNQDYPEDREGALTDIYRRHEVGFSLNPDATPTQIGAFLQSGWDDLDPWNLGAREAMVGVEGDMQAKGVQDREDVEPIVFTELKTKMVLMGFRRKFNLCARPKSGGVINIELSCDHTVGCKPEDIPLEIPDAKGFEAYFEKLSRETYPERFNVEMELEHLGAGGATPSGGEGSGNQSRGESSVNMESIKAKFGHVGKQAPVKQEPQESAPKSPPEGFPSRRPYQREDANDPNFNTRSFSVFHAAHKQIITALQTSLTGEVPKTYLQSDRQKLETIRDKLKILEDVSSGQDEQSLPDERSLPSTTPPSRRLPKEPSGQKPKFVPRSSTIAPDGNCLYNAVIVAGKLGIDAMLLREFATDLLLTNEALRKKMTKYGSDLNMLLTTIFTNHQWAGDEGDLVPVVLAYYVNRPICICDVANKTKHVIQSPVDGEPIVVFYKDSHYEATPPEEAGDWQSWGTGQRSEDVEASSSIAIVDAPLPQVTVDKRYKLNQRVTIDSHGLSPSDRVEVLEVKSDRVRVKYSRGNAGFRAGWMDTAALDLSTEGKPIWSKFNV